MSWSGDQCRKEEADYCWDCWDSLDRLRNGCGVAGERFPALLHVCAAFRTGVCARRARQIPTFGIFKKHQFGFFLVTFGNESGVRHFLFAKSPEGVQNSFHDVTHERHSLTARDC
jgi:hypothetical protein